MLIMILMFIFPKFVSLMFFVQIWFHLAFFKLTEILCRGALLYAYYNFNVYFSRIFVSHVFWTNSVPKFEVFYID